MKRCVPRPARSLFEPLVGTEFQILIEHDRTVLVRLVEATALTPTTTSADLPIRPDPFSLVFRGNRDSNLTQHRYLVRHEELGALELFLVPIGPGIYEAVFN